MDPLHQKKKISRALIKLNGFSASFILAISKCSTFPLRIILPFQPHRLQTASLHYGQLQSCLYLCCLGKLKFCLLLFVCCSYCRECYSDSIICGISSTSVKAFWGGFICGLLLETLSLTPRSNFRGHNQNW